MTRAEKLGGYQKEKISPGDIVNHLLLPPDIYIAHLPKIKTLRMSGGLTVLDDSDSTDHYSIRNIVDHITISQTQSRLKLSTIAERYFSTRSLTYLRELEKAESSFSKIKLKKPLEAIVVIPVHAYSEQANIVNTLEQYKKQNIDPSSFAIFLFLNDDGDQKNILGRQASINIIEKFIIENPNLNISFFYKKLSENERSIGKIKRMAVDFAFFNYLKRIKSKKSKDTLLIMNDVDIVWLSNDYLEQNIEYHQKKPLVDITTQVLDFDEIRSFNIPVLNIISRVHSFIRQILLKNADLTITLGTDIAIKTSAWYQIADQLNQEKRGEDIEIGAAINRLRGSFDTVVKMFSMVPRVISSARRIVLNYDRGSLETMQSLDYTPINKDRVGRRFRLRKDRDNTDFFEELYFELTKTFLKFTKKYPLLDCPSAPPDHVFNEALRYIGIEGYFRNGQLTVMNNDKLTEAMKLLMTNKSK